MSVGTRFVLDLGGSRNRLAAMLAAPSSDGRVVACQQNLGHGETSKLAGARVLGVLQAAVGTERFVNRAFRVSQNSRNDSAAFFSAELYAI